MDQATPHTSLSKRDRNSQDSKKSRDVLIHQYIKAARERLEAINGPSSPSNPSTSTTTSSTTHTSASSRSSGTSNQVHEDQSKLSSSTPQWPLRNEPVEPNISSVTSNPPLNVQADPEKNTPSKLAKSEQFEPPRSVQPVAIDIAQPTPAPEMRSTTAANVQPVSSNPVQSSFSNATQTKPVNSVPWNTAVDPQLEPLHSHRVEPDLPKEPRPTTPGARQPIPFSLTGGATPPRPSGRTPPRAGYVPPPNAQSFDQTRRPTRPGYPPPRGGHRGRGMRYPTAPRFASSAQRGQNAPVVYHPDPVPRPSRGDARRPNNQQGLGLAPPVQHSRNLAEEVRTHKSEKSTDTTDNTMDILNEYADDASNEAQSRRSSRTAQPAAAQAAAATSVVGRLRQASLGTVQKPVVTNILNPPLRGEFQQEETNARSTAQQNGAEIAKKEFETDSDSNHPRPGQAVTTSSPAIEEAERAQFSPMVVNLQADSVGTTFNTPPKDKTSPILQSPIPVLQQDSVFKISPGGSPILSLDSKFSPGSGKSGIAKKDSRELLSPQDIDAPKKTPDSAYSSPSRTANAQDVGGVRDSTTSLRGLILRNMRLASNLERGVTSSRFGIDWILEATGQNTDRKRSPTGSSSSLIDTFPGDSTAEKARSVYSDYHGANRYGSPNKTSPNSGWPRYPWDNEEFRHEDAKRSRKRCCGIPLWALILIVVVLIILIAAAIIIPVVLVVIPQQNQDASTPTSQTSPANQACNRQLGCQNGGSGSADAGGSCFCLCATGWTGPSCSIKNSQSCVSIDISDASAATIGSDVARIIEQSQSKFSVPLHASELIALFYEANMTCNSQNGFVSFDTSTTMSGPIAARNYAQRVRAIPHSTVVHVLATVSPMRNDRILEARQASVSNGINIAPTSAASTSYPSTSTTTSIPPSSTPTASNSYSKAVNFARTATLYVLQTSKKMDLAKTAHENLEDYLQQTITAGSGFDDTHVELGHGWIANFATWSIYYNGY